MPGHHDLAGGWLSGRYRQDATEGPTSAARIDQIVGPGLTLNPADNGWVSPALDPTARRR